MFHIYGPHVVCHHRSHAYVCVCLQPRYCCGHSLHPRERTFSKQLVSAQWGPASLGQQLQLWTLKSPHPFTRGQLHHIHWSYRSFIEEVACCYSHSKPEIAEAAGFPCKIKIWVVSYVPVSAHRLQDKRDKLTELWETELLLLFIFIQKHKKHQVLNVSAGWVDYVVSKIEGEDYIYSLS